MVSRLKIKIKILEHLMLHLFIHSNRDEMNNVFNAVVEFAQVCVEGS
jgi:hypothetical protein